MSLEMFLVWIASAILIAYRVIQDGRHNPRDTMLGPPGSLVRIGLTMAFVLFGPLGLFCVWMLTDTTRRK